MVGRESPNERSNNSRDKLRSQRYIVTNATLCTRLNKRNKRLYGGFLSTPLVLHPSSLARPTITCLFVLPSGGTTPHLY